MKEGTQKKWAFKGTIPGRGRSQSFQLRPGAYPGEEEGGHTRKRKTFLLFWQKKRASMLERRGSGGGGGVGSVGKEYWSDQKKRPRKISPFRDKEAHNRKKQ